MVYIMHRSYMRIQFIGKEKLLNKGAFFFLCIQKIAFQAIVEGKGVNTAVLGIQL